MHKLKLTTAFLLVFIMISCSSTKMIPVDKAETGKTVKIYMKSGEKFTALLYENNEDDLVIVSKEMHKKINVPKRLVKRIDYLDEYLDYNGDPVSNAEINRYKGKKHSVTYTMGGFVLGGIGGTALALPFWYADTGIKPYFIGGVGAVIGGVYFGFKGKKQDEERAVETIRLIRKKKAEIKEQTNQKQNELKELKKIEKEKKELKEKLKKRD